LAVQFEMRDSGGITLITLKQNINLDEAKEMFQAVAANKPGKLRLYDMSAGFHHTISEVQDMVSFGSKLIDQPGSRVAIVSEDLVTFGMARVYDAFRTKEHTNFGVFKTLEDGLRWLKAEEPSESGET